MASSGRPEDDAAEAPDETAEAPVVIKKYANRRLYNTATSSYVTLDHLCGMVKKGVDFVVYDAKTGEDITRSVLTQIIFEEESKGQNMLPIRFLRQLIGFYGDSLQSLVPRYLEVSMESFARNQEEMRRRMTEAFGGLFPFRQMEEMGRQNMAVFQQALSLFNPFAGAVAGNGAAREQKPEPAEESAARELRRLQEQLEKMQAQIDRLAKERGG